MLFSPPLENIMVENERSNTQATDTAALSAAVVAGAVAIFLSPRREGGTKCYYIGNSYGDHFWICMEI